MGKWFWGILSLAIISVLVGWLFFKDCNQCKKGQSKAAVETAVVVPKVETEVKTEVAPKPTVQVVSPYTFSATKDADGKVDLAGYVRSKAERQRIVGEAEALFGDNLRGKKLRLAAGSPNENWGDLISLHLPQLASLDTGTFSLDDSQALLRGTVGDVSVRDNINALVTGLPEGYVGAANITVPDTAAVNAGEVQSAALCQSLFDQLKGDARINFASAKAEIRGAPSFDLLNTLASAANQCKSFHVSIEGHTDDQGADDYNQFLSEQRASTVVAYLADNGVDRSRLAATGFGETQPIAANDTPEGRAANRRINFVVTKSE